MKALSLVPGTTSVTLEERPEPRVEAADDIKVKVLRVGICGTDREEAAGGRARAPAGRKNLVIGHEMMGRVEEAGKGVTQVAVGDLVVLSVRRGCGKCLPCTMNRPDMCTTGEFTERGIWGADGYDAEYVVDKEHYAVRLPGELSAAGVLTEPTTIVEKAIDEALRLQCARLPQAASTPDWYRGRRCLVAGLGPVGLLGAMVLRLRGADVLGLDILDPGSAKPLWLKAIDGTYIDGRTVHAGQVGNQIGPMDVILEAAGIASLDFDLLEALALNGIFLLTGIPGGDRPLQIDGPALMRTLVLKNQAMVGSVNASRDHFRMAVADLAAAGLRWPGHVEKLITHIHPFTDFAAALARPAGDEIKAVIQWGS